MIIAFAADDTDFDQQFNMSFHSNSDRADSFFVSEAQRIEELCFRDITWAKDLGHIPLITSKPVIGMS